MFLTDRQQAVSVFPTDLIHIVKTTDQSQNPAGSSFKANISQIFELTAGCCLTAGTFNNGTITFINSSGSTAFTVPNIIFTGGSGNCINNLYVNNIWPCTTNINVQPQSQGKVFFGAMSGANGFTVDLVTNTSPATRLGLNTNTPQFTFDFYSYDGRSRFYYDDTSIANLHQISLSGDPSLISVYGAATQGSIILSLNAVGTTNSSYQKVGAPGETSLFSSTNARGLNIISQKNDGNPQPDYIRFYAGTSVSGASYQPHIHIQGSGATTGFMGIGQGNVNPTSLIDISGVTGYDQLRLRTAYVPTSSADINGNNGNICWGVDGGDYYIYVKTSVGWRRGQLTGPWS